MGPVKETSGQNGPTENKAHEIHVETVPEDNRDRRADALGYGGCALLAAVALAVGLLNGIVPTLAVLAGIGVALIVWSVIMRTPPQA